MNQKATSWFSSQVRIFLATPGEAKQKSFQSLSGFSQSSEKGKVQGDVKLQFPEYFRNSQIDSVLSTRLSLLLIQGGRII